MILQVKGRVQGVGYRYAVRNYAQKRGLVGWVKNNTDGSVTVVAEGEEEDLRELKAFCYNGVTSADVSEMKEHWKEAVGRFTDFMILY